MAKPGYKARWFDSEPTLFTIPPPHTMGSLPPLCLPLLVPLPPSPLVLSTSPLAFCTAASLQSSRSGHKVHISACLSPEARGQVLTLCALPFSPSHWPVGCLLLDTLVFQMLCAFSCLGVSAYAVPLFGQLLTISFPPRPHPFPR